MKKSIIYIIFTGIFLFSCKTSPVADFNKVKQIIESNTWILQDENGNAKGFNGQDVTMKFRQENGLQASGFAGCNNYFTSVNLEPTSIGFSQPGATLMACPGIESEQAFLDLLTQVNGYEVVGNELRFYQNKILLLRFRAGN